MNCFAKDLLLYANKRLCGERVNKKKYNYQKLARTKYICMYVCILIIYLLCMIKVRIGWCT